MNPEQWKQVKEIFHAALEVAPAERVRFLDKACSGDAALRHEVESLIASHERTGDFIDAPAYKVAADLLADDPDSLREGQVIGDYKVLRKIGRGGMGEVYLARDQKLGRSVALKVLPDSLNSFTDRLRRFETEACAASALNHPNILTIYGMGQVDSRHFIATEFIEGETLRRHIPTGGMKIEEALEVSVQIVSALTAAHTAGIIHRDIKPENIMVRRDGYVKVLDFGLAKLADDWRGDDENTPTRPILKTDSGAVMGTVQYMSPEQARGLRVDARTDIWSCGIVLYEMITGRAPFDGETSSHTIVSILEDGMPPLKDARPDTPAELEAIIGKALMKDRNERYQTAKELLVELKELKHRLEFQAELERSTSATKAASASGQTGKDFHDEKAGDPSTAKTVRIEAARNTSSFEYLTNSFRRNWRWALLAFFVPALAALVVFSGYRYWGSRRIEANFQKSSNTSRSTGALKSKQVTSWAGLDIFPSFSPDGNSVAYSSDHNGSFEIYVKQLTPGGREIQLTSDGQQNFQPVWSPDGQRIAFHSNKRGGIWIVPSLGGAPKQLTDFGSWPAFSPDGQLIVFQSQSFMDVGVTAAGAIPPSTLWIVPANGGSPRQLTQDGNPSGGHGSPTWSPDGKRILFVTTELGTVKMDLWSVALDGSGLKWMTEKTKSRGIYDPVYSPDGRYIYFTGGGIGTSLWGIFRLPLSPETGEVLEEPEIIKETGATANKYLRMSADGKRLIHSQLTMTSNIWSISLTQGGEAKEAPVLLTEDTTYRKSYPAFSPDGKRIAYQRNSVGGGLDIWIMDANGKNSTQVTTDTASDLFPMWFPDGNRIAFLSARQGQGDFWSVDIQTGREQLLVKLNQDVGYPQMSPDGTEIAFNSRKSGTSNVWLVPVKGGEPRQLTFEKELTGFPRWSPDSRYIAYEIKKGDSTQLFILPREGGEPVQITFERGEHFTGDWSPDGSRVSFAGYRDGVWNLYWASRDGKQQKQLTKFTSINAYLRYPTWSPAGNQIVYEFAEITGNVWITNLE